MRNLSLTCLLFLAASAANAGEVTVQAATGDWSKLPQLSQRGYDHLDTKVQAKLFEIAQSEQCSDFVLKQERLDFRIGFAVQYGSEGELSKLLLPQMNCPEALGVTGGAVLAMIEAGDYAPTGKSVNGWYQGTLGFSYAGDNAGGALVPAVQPQPGAVRGPDENEKVCERIKQLGSRLSTKQLCLTRAEWAQRRQDDRETTERVQMQRGCRDAQC